MEADQLVCYMIAFVFSPYCIISWHFLLDTRFADMHVTCGCPVRLFWSITVHEWSIQREREREHGLKPASFFEFVCVTLASALQCIYTWRAPLMFLKSWTMMLCSNSTFNCSPCPERARARPFNSLQASFTSGMRSSCVSRLTSVFTLTKGKGVSEELI